MPEAEEPREPGEQTAGCPVRMFNTPRCGRPIYAARGDADPLPVCLMHSRHPRKDVGAFRQEIGRILLDAGDGEANFSGFVFPAWDFGRLTFNAKCIFNEAVFTGRVNFSGATFTRPAVFSEAQFLGEADFLSTIFAEDAVFAWALFAMPAVFTWAIFRKIANFREARFLGAVYFREAIFRGDLREIPRGPLKRVFPPDSGKPKSEGRAPGPIFSLAYFEYPRLAVFYKTNLGLALFHDCDVSELRFSDVRWRERKNHKSMVFEENAPLLHYAAESLRTAIEDYEHRNYRLIAELYQQLKKNYDDRGDYWTAGDFHYGEMEMKRLSSRRKNPVVRWLHRHLGLVAWYKYASEYGESYLRPAAWLLFFLLVLFPVLYPWIGLRAAKPAAPVSAVEQGGHGYPPTLSYSAYIHSAGTQPGEDSSRTWWLIMRNSLRTSVDIALLRRELAYEPAGDLGWALSRVELLLTSTLFALFLLAVRRQFRR